MKFSTCLKGISKVQYICYLTIFKLGGHTCVVGIFLLSYLERLVLKSLAIKAVSKGIIHLIVKKKLSFVINYVIISGKGILMFVKLSFLMLILKTLINVIKFMPL